MARTTIEEASSCPICGEAGRKESVTPGERGSKIYTYVCENIRCRWFENGGWVVQVLADGTVPVRDKDDREFPKLSNDQLAYGQRYLEDVIGEDLRDKK